MATQVWRGDAQSVAQVVTVQVTADDAATTYTITINGKTVSVAGTGTGVNATASALQVALAASSIAEFREVTWTAATDTVTGTAVTAGVPFTASSSVGGGTGTIGSVTTATASSGPNDWSAAANWSTGSVPVTGDDVYLTNSASSVLYGLAQSGVTLGSLNVDSTFTGTVGLPRYNAGGGYLEYRPTYLAVSATVVNIGTGTGTGSGRIKLNVGANAATFNVFATGQSAEQGVPAVQLLGSDPANALNCQQGTIGVALEPNQTSELATTRIGFQTSAQTDVTLTMGPGVTHPTITQNGGTLTVANDVTTLTMNAGTAYVLGTAGVTTLALQEGTLYFQSNGTIAAATVGTGGTLDFSQDPRTRTVTDLTLAAQSTLNDPNKTVTFTNPFAVQNCGLSEINLNLGQNFSLQRS